NPLHILSYLYDYLSYFTSSQIAVLFFFFFFFQCSRAPRDLHSFPTRRSSDLDQHGTHGNAYSLHTRNVDQNTPFQNIIAPVIYRSEEHTSELQSRFDLVCRLLLEKKKKKKK